MCVKIYLASRSPRRAEILKQIGVDFEILPADIDESVLPDELPQTYVLRLARAKAVACVNAVSEGSLMPRLILAADTTVCMDGRILGKPEDAAEAYVMLQQMSGGWHEVHTALALATESGIETAISSTTVQMAVLSEAEISAYIASGEPFDKAGAYGIQGLAGMFICRIEGSYTGVMGLPVYETAQLLKNAGFSLL